MKLFSTAVLSLLPLLAVAADDSKGARFQKWHAKSLKQPVLRLDDENYDAVVSPPRDYAVLVEHTAMPAQFGCEACKTFHPEYNILASSWIKGDKNGDSRLLFGSIDFPDGKTVFQKLQLTTAPVLVYYPPTSGPFAKADSTPIRLDFTSGVQSAESVHAWLSRQLPDVHKPPVVRPFNYVRAATIVTVILGLITFIGVAGPYLLPIVQNRNLWAGVSLIVVLMFTSGHMFNHIRKVPYVSGDGKGGITYFAGGFGNQLGMESQLVAGIYGVLSFATISLAVKVPRIADSKRQGLEVAIWSGIMFCMYSFLMSVFKIKNSGYPFHIPPF